MKNILEKYAYKGEIVSEKEEKPVSGEVIEGDALKLAQDIQKFLDKASGFLNPKLMQALKISKKFLRKSDYINEETDFEITNDTLKKMSSSDKREMKDAISDTGSDSDIRIVDENSDHDYSYNVTAKFRVFVEDDTPEAAEARAVELLSMINQNEDASNPRVLHVNRYSKSYKHEGRKLSKKEFLEEMKLREKGYIVKENYKKDDFLKKYKK